MGGRKEQRVKRPGAVLLAASLLLGGYGLGIASDREATTLTVDVSAADHELGEGYFSLGDDMTAVVKPGSPLHAFLARHRGQTVTITFAEAQGRQLSRLDR